MNDWLISAKLNAELLQKLQYDTNNIITTNQLVSDITGRSTTGNNCQQYELLEYINDLESFKLLRVLTEKTLRENNLFLKKNLKPISCWTVIGKEGTYHRLHKHNDVNLNHISTVIYLTVLESKIETEGAFYAVLKNEKNENDFIEYKPDTADMLIFPIWILHGTYPQSTELRQSLNIDYILE